MSSDLEKAIAKKPTKRQDVIPSKDLLKTGSTMLDLAISGRRAGGFAKGHYYWIVGDSSSGKTFLTLTCLAEASINKHFDNYDFIYDNVEDGALMDFEKYFGPRMAKRVCPPAGKKEAPEYSTTIEEFYFNLDDAFENAEAKNKPFIYILDSMDALGTDYGDSKFKEAKAAARKGKDAKGDYGDGKAKINSTRIRSAMNRLGKTGSILIVLSQTRDDIGAGMYAPNDGKTHAGGHALKFYSTVQLWSSVGSKIKRTVNDKDVVVGVHCRVKTQKNRITGKERMVEFPIFYDTGIDDIGGMVDFLTEWKVWPKKAGIIDASDAWAGVSKRRDELIAWIEENDLRADLEDAAEAGWAEIEAQLKVERKSKYE